MVTEGDNLTPKLCNDGCWDSDPGAAVGLWVGVIVLTTTVTVVKVEVRPFAVSTVSIVLVDDVMNGVVGSGVLGGGGVVSAGAVVGVVGEVAGGLVALVDVVEGVVEVVEALGRGDVPVLELEEVDGPRSDDVVGTEDGEDVVGADVVGGVAVVVCDVVVVVVEVVVRVDEVEVLFEFCRFAKAYTLEANLMSSLANASTACRFELNTPSLNCGYTACNA